MIKGIPVSKGYAIAKVFLLKKTDIDASKKVVLDTELEIRRFHDAIRDAKQEILLLKQKSLSRFGEETAKIFDAHLMIADDPEFKMSVETLIMQERCNLTYAIKTVVNRFVKLFEGLDHPYLKERAIDIKDVSERILSHALGITGHDLSDIHEEIILVGEDITPSETTQVNPQYVKGFITEQGGITSHSAIIARLLGIPAVTAAKDILKKVKHGDEIILDGHTGKILLNFDEKTRELYHEKKHAYRMMIDELNVYKGLKTYTKDQYLIPLYANIGLPKDVDYVYQYDAEGVGLFRTELLYMDRKELPTEDEQYQAYTSVLKAMQGKQTTIRTLDIGGDKHLPYLDLEHELNPFLGERAIRLCLAKPDLFKTQLRALLRASIHGSLSIMIPMISTKHEIVLVKKLLDDIKKEFDASNIPYGKYLLGIMIEVPSAVMLSDSLAAEVDFFSIGTNDLIQYVFAADRTHEKLHHYYQPLHPVILNMIHTVCQSAKKHHIPVSVCGEMASHPDQGIVLLGLGVDALSMTPSEILKMRKRLSLINLDDIKGLAHKFLRYDEEELVIKDLQKALKKML